MADLSLTAFGPELLKPFDIHVAKGETVTLSGPSGSGKSLFLRAVADLDPHQGIAASDGKVCDEINPQEWRRHVGYLPAESHWWAATVQEHFLHKHPKRLEKLGLPDESMQWQISRLSTGERQRLAVMRVLDRNPQVLLLDEPTANLGSAHAHQMEECINQYRNETGAAVLWVSHDPRQQERVGDRHFIIQDGSIVEVESCI